MSPPDKREALLRLVDALVEDVLSASDADIAAEAAEDGEDLCAAAAKMLALFERAAADVAAIRKTLGGA